MAKHSKKRKVTAVAASVSAAGTSMDRPAGRKPSRQAPALDWKWILQAAVIALAAFWVFWPARNGQWIGDDSLYITSNPLLNDPARLWKAWFHPGSFVEYYPIEQSFQWAQWQLWHNETLGYHLTNIVLHVISALLIWRLLSRFGLRLAWLGGLIFAVHPMMVDSVALINELKTALSLPPFLLAMEFYIDYEEKGRWRDYGLALGLFVIAMLCKITMAAFPVVILLYAWWKRKRIGWRDLVASAPFFAVALILSLLTIWSGEWYGQLLGASTDLTSQSGWWFRLVLAGQIICFYLSRCLLPFAPMPIYHRWTVDPSAPGQFLPWFIICGMIFYLWTKRETWGRHALLGLGFFLIMLGPFLGLHWISYMNETWVLEHLLYIPIIGPIGLVVAGLEQVDKQLPHAYRPCGIGVVAVAVALLAFQSHAYAAMYINEETICAYTITQNPESVMAHYNLAGELLKKGKFDEAMNQLRTAVALDPRNPEAENDLGDALLQKGRVDEAIDHLRKSLKLNPDNLAAQSNLGEAFFQKGLVDDAIAQYRKALKIDAGNIEVLSNLGEAFLQKGRFDEAIAWYEKAQEINPGNPQVHFNLGNAFFQKGQIADAIAQHQRAVEINPDYTEAHYNLGVELLNSGKIDGAIEHLQKVVENSPAFPDAHNNLGIAFAQKGQLGDAIAQFEETLRLDPNNGSAQKNLADAQAAAHQTVGQTR
jgi:protein O-mannosyl-transferase